MSDNPFALGLAGKSRFEAAADAIQSGDLDTLRALLNADPALVRMRSPFPHHATLLHNVAANGIEVSRQLESPPNAVDILRLLLERGAEPDARCDTYGGGSAQTTLVLLVSSCVPAAAGVQASLVEALCRGGARVDGLDDDGLPLWTAITFGYTAAAEALARCGARVDNLVFAAALGQLAAVEAYLTADGSLVSPRRRARSGERVGVHGPPLDADRMIEYALIWSVAHGRTEVVEWLLDKQPDLAVAEPLFQSTALGMARYRSRTELVALLEAHAARQQARQ